MQWRSVRGRLFPRQERGGPSSSTTEYYIAGNLHNNCLSQLVLYASAIRFISSKVPPSLITFRPVLVRPRQRLQVPGPRWLSLAHPLLLSQYFGEGGGVGLPRAKGGEPKLGRWMAKAETMLQRIQWRKLAFVASSFTPWNGAGERGATDVMIHPRDEDFEPGGLTEYRGKSP